MEAQKPKHKQNESTSQTMKDEAALAAPSLPGRARQLACQSASQRCLLQKSASHPACTNQPARANQPRQPEPASQPARQADRQPASRVVLRGVALLYESPGGNQVDGLPPVATWCEALSRIFPNRAPLRGFEAPSTSWSTGKCHFFKVVKKSLRIE